MNQTTAQPAETGRFDIQSTDDTWIAVWADGDGPPLVGGASVTFALPTCDDPST